MDGETHLVIKGFNAIVFVSPEEGDNFEVILLEGGNEVYQVVIDIPVDEDSDQAYSEDLIHYAAEAAVDLYEAARGTLGEGAGVTMKESNSEKKQACASSQWEDWYFQLKGTPYEEQATQMLDQYVELEYANNGTGEELEDLYAQKRTIEHDLDLLNLERMKSADPKQTVIIINASRKKAWLYNASDIQEYLEKFKNCGSLEIQAIASIQELLDTKMKIKNLEGSSDDTWEQQRDLEAAMEELLLQHIQQGAIEALPDTGMDANPAMAADLADLMQTVDLNTPVEPMIARNAFEEVEPAEDRLIELGEQHEGLDPAEVALDDQKFEIGDKVTFSKKFEDVGDAGVLGEISSGTSAVVESLWDGQGDCFLVALESGRVVKAPVSVLK